MQRVNQIVSQLSSASFQSPLLSGNTVAANARSPKSDDDVVIVSAVRTAIGKARRGMFRDTYVEELLAAVMKATIERTKINPKIIGDIVVGTVLGPGSQRANECRIAQFLAGIPEEVPIQTVNRQCSSGLQAVATIAANIKSGNYEVGLACGVESMSTAKFLWEGSMNPKVFLNQQAKDCLLPMGITSENVAAVYKISRKEQDELAVMSHKRAAAAIQSGKFKAQIVPLKTKVKDPKTGQEKEIIADTDEGVRADATLEGLTKLPPAFDKKGSTTAGNASQVSDGAAAVLLMTRRKAKELGLSVLGRFISFSAVGVPPRVMGVGPAFAIPEAVKQAQLTINDVDLFEINEAFASQAVYCVKKLGLSWDKVNVNGGAIALGHPLGCTGARQIADLLPEMQRRKVKFGVVSMCIGSGMGAAAVIENEML